MSCIFGLASGVGIAGSGLPVQLAKSRGTPQLLAAAGVRRIERRAPRGRISLIDQLRYRKPGEVGVAQQLGTVVKRTPTSLSSEMDGLRGAASQAGQVIAFKNVQRFQQRDAAGTGRRSADNFVSAIRPADRLAFLDFIFRKVPGG